MSLKAADIQVGDIIAKTFYAKVREVRPALIDRRGRYLFASAPSEVETVDLTTKESVWLKGADLIEEFTSADRYTSTTEVTQGELAQEFVSAGGLPFTVCFTKLDDTERVLRGLRVTHENLLGRSVVKDLDVVKGSPLRTVDHRTLQWLILDGVKYMLKD